MQKNLTMYIATQKKIEKKSNTRNIRKILDSKKL